MGPAPDTFGGSPLPGPVGLPHDAVVAIDGPAGSGKSTTARGLAQRFGLLYVDSGAMYRALTLAAIQAGLPGSDERGLVGLLGRSRLELLPGKREATVHWDGRDVSAAIRTPAVDAAVSEVSAHPGVRRLMVERQRALGRAGGVVIEGRDIGSVVFPLATAKIFLDASLATRVERRFRQYRQQGQEVARKRIREELAARDRQDSDRPESPLTVSPDAMVLDSGGWSLAEQTERVARAVLVQAETRRAAAEAAAVPDELLLHYRWVYIGLKAIARFHGLRVIGRAGPAAAKSAIIACNHISWWDPVMVGSTLGRCRVRTLAKAELFRLPPARVFFRILDSIPIQRTGYDFQAFDAAVETLRQGHNLFIFPEGTRRPICRPGPVRSGLGILVQKSGAPVQPVFVRGTCHLEPGGSKLSPLEVRYGPVFRMHALAYLLERLDPRQVSGRIARLCEAYFRELQAHSFAENPPTDWELAAGERQERAYRRKTHRLFGSRAAGPPDA